MLLEISCVLGLIAFVILLVKEKDLRYLVGFVFGLIFAFLIEPLGISRRAWQYQNIIAPFNYSILGVPICIYLLYAITAAIVVLLVKIMLKLRKRYKEKLDKITGYDLIAVGIIFLFLRYAIKLYDLHLYIGLTFIMVGLYLLVKNPVMFYVGIIALVSDFVFEYLYILNKQFSYATSQGDVSVGWFLGAAILTAIFLLIGNHLKLHLSKRKKK